MSAVQAVELSREFRSKDSVAKALEGVSFDIGWGEVFGLLGPNGSGKTTLVKIFTTLLYPTSGKAYVAGHDVVREADAIRPRINLVSGGETPGYGIITVKENLWFFSQLYGLTKEVADERIDRLIEELEMGEYKDKLMSHLSTGYKQRLNLARGFINDPDVVFLDEPTLGLDVLSARLLRRIVTKWAHGEAKKAVLLTTHYMYEADEICDKIGILSKGRLLKVDTPRRLKQSISHKTSLKVELRQSDANLDWLGGVKGVEGFSAKSADGGTSVRVVLKGEEHVADILSAFRGRGTDVTSFSKTEPTLEDVYVAYVGGELENE
jgi:ABC-2 type transport system ATP-binding protein